MRRATGWCLLASLGVALLALPGVGQDETPTDPYEPNDEFSNAHEITLPFTTESAAIAPGDHDLYAFTLEETHRVLVDVDADETGSSLDPLMVLMDADGEPIVMSDDADELDPRLERTLEAGRYVLLVRGYDVLTSGPYQLRVASLGSPTCQSGTLSAGTSDRWELGPYEPGSTVVLSLNGPSGTDFDLWVYEVISEDPLLTAVEGRGVSLSPQERVNVQTGESSTAYIAEVFAVEGSGDYDLCAASAQGGMTP